MNATDRAALDAIATPIDEHGPLRACVVGDASGWRTAWAHDGGRHKEAFGALYSDARAAATASRYLNARSGAGVG